MLPISRLTHRSPRALAGKRRAQDAAVVDLTAPLMKSLDFCYDEFPAELALTSCVWSHQGATTPVTDLAENNQHGHGRAAADA